MKLKGWKQIPEGGLIIEAGNSEEYQTGSWRTFRPVWDFSKCIHCLQCYILCPDSCIEVSEGKVKGANLYYCKGCGICANECPEKVKAITMIEEVRFHKEEEE
jgi:pyruvate ferredoxin oxidoreductase delta subunit